MALYVDSAYLDHIIVVAYTLPLAGVTTNPSIVLAAREHGQNLDSRAVLELLLERAPGDIFMQPSIANEERAYQEAIAYIKVSPERVVPKIPLTPAGMRVARRLKLERRRVAFTAVTTVAQVYVAAMLEAEFVIPYYNRLLRSGVDANERIQQMACVLSMQGSPTRILTASIKSAEEATAALIAGAHDLTVPPQVLLEMVTDPASEQAVEKFEQDWKKLQS